MIDKKTRAGRALLGWTREDLATHANISVTSVQNIEEGHSPSQKTIEKIIKAFHRNGVVLIEDGVRLLDHSLVQFDGKNWFSEILEDALQTLQKSKNKEMLIFGSDHSVSSPDVIKGFQKLVSVGVALREMVQEGDTFIMGEVENYRWIPKSYFKNHVTLIYADKVVNDFGNHGIMFQNKQWAETERNKFNFMWNGQPPLNIDSTANVRYKI